jgi:hypothetical protein
MLLLMVMVPVCWGYPRQANRQCCAELAMLLLVLMVLVRWCRPRHADRECYAVDDATAGDEGDSLLVPPSPG